MRDKEALAEVVTALVHQPAYAVDTEFHRERTYFAKVALVQVAWRGDCVLVDPLAVDLAPLAEVLEGPGTAVMHAGSQDLEVLQRACGTVPSRLFDTQLAAGFLGFSTPGLGPLVARVLDVHLPKASRLTDWMVRPLSRDVEDYAASDVLYLLEVARLMREELVNTGRLTWAEEECELLRSRGWGAPDPDAAWLRMKEGRQLRGRARGVAQSVAAWRERRAAELDQPVRFVLSDLAIVGIANKPPTTLEGLAGIRGLDGRFSKGKLGEALLAAVQDGARLSDGEVRSARREEFERELRPAVALVTAWLGQVGRDLRIDPALLATRHDLAAFLNGEPDARLASGWRGELLGRPLKALIEGEFALAFDGQGGLALERRSGQPVLVDLPRPTAPWTRE